jgi:formamidopyrimidine-DNA glycosylase
MPELPEVEVTRLGVTPHIDKQTVTQVVVRNKNLRWPVPEEVQKMVNLPVLAVRRRAKYLLIDTEAGTAILHLGMSGKLRVVDKTTPVIKHDHVDIIFSNGKLLRLNDPRRFGAFLWQNPDEEHILLQKLGPEPLSEEFNAALLYERSRNKKVALKNFIMDNHVVVGVGNIYANESLFKAGLHPLKPAGKLTKAQSETLTAHIKETLAYAIKQGGTTLKDFTQADGNPGYFAQELLVYGQKGKPCSVCKTELEEIKVGQRASVFCSKCQKK